jgi:hypothetical protein
MSSHCIVGALQEVQAMAVVCPHPHIVQYYAAWAEADGGSNYAASCDSLFIQMELCKENLGKMALDRQRHGEAFTDSELRLILNQVQ